jgi:hypothetical protein
VTSQDEADPACLQENRVGDVWHGIGLLEEVLPMTRLERAKKTVGELTKQELKAFAKWFVELQAERWDQQIEADARAGRLDKLAEKAKADLAAGRVRPL